MGRKRVHPRPVVNQEYGFWTVRVVEYRERSRRNECLCECRCGTKKPVRESNLVRGLTTSCGCDNARKTGDRFRKHGGKAGGSPTPEYTVWQGVKRRCYNRRDKRYDDYGGRGIRMCDRWRNSFAAFLEDMGVRPSPAHQLERKDNDGHYEKDNCRWATRKEQARNKRNNRIITAVDGTSRCLAEWAELLRLDGRVIQSLLRRGAKIDAIQALIEGITHD